jgi:mannosyl-oligosaccharide glucosidase
VAKNQYINELVTKVGYINLFPFFTGVLREELSGQEEKETIRAVINKIVHVIGDKDQLLSEGGIRSLSISDSEYGTLDNYWRGSVWLPINYMVLRACKKYYWKDENIRDVYRKVRDNLIKSVY